MLVEFRELPAVRPDGGRSPLARVVAEALVRKPILMYPMIFPFFIGEQDQLPELRRAYLIELKRHVIDTYGSILEQMMELEWHQCDSDGEKEPEIRRARLLEVGRRIRLYELSAPDPCVCPSFGNRLFLLRDHGHDGLRSKEPVTELWQWVSSPDKVRMFQKETSSSELKVIELGFFPIIDFWDEEQRLPQSVGELTKFASQRKAMDWLATSFGDPSTNWKVFGVDGSGSDRLDPYVEGFIEKMNAARLETAMHPKVRKKK
jgi:hypothetical protein